jgi:nitroreductase
MPELDYFHGLTLKNRSYRRFNEKSHISEDLLKYFVSLARITPSAANLQPLRYSLVFEEDKKESVFLNIFWAAYLKDWDGPEKGERPGGYIVISRDASLNGNHWMFDVGISAQTILLGAVDKGFGGCMIASLKSKEIKESLKIKDPFEPVLVIALGDVVEDIVIEDIDESGDVKYYRDESNTHHVPKRRLEDLLI